MQEVYHDGSEGEIVTANSLEELLPKIKESLEKPNVKYVKVFRAGDKLTSEEEKKSFADILRESSRIPSRWRK